MTTLLPLLEPYEKQHTYCTYCPKLCRFACPVSTEQARESTTPWAKMTSVHHVSEGNLGMSPSVASTWYACTGCQRCQTHCAHGNDVGGALHAARAEAVSRGVAIPEAKRIIDEHARRERSAADMAAALFEGNPEVGSRVAFVPGCTATATAANDATAGLSVCRELYGSNVAVVADRCCGLPLLDAGDVDGFKKAATGWQARLGAFDEVVFLDPGCQHALAKRAPELGVDAPAASMRHISQLAAEHLQRFNPVEGVAGVRYHDPCRLGRGLGVYDEPRRVLARIVGRPVDEFHHRRQDSTCSGAGGQLPRTDPPTAAQIARRRLQEHEWVGGGQVVSACPGSTRQLAAQETAPVVSFVSLLERSLQQP